MSAGYQILANDYDGVLDAHALTRFVPLPDSAQVVPAGGGVSVWDRALTWVGGEYIMVVDTARSSADGDVPVFVHRLLQAWDPLTTSWVFAIDSLAAHVPWVEPGGARGNPVASEVWSLGQDTLRIPLDSATVSALAAAPADVQGLLLRIAGAPAQLRVSATSLYADFRGTVRPDTVIRVQIPVSRRTFIHNPRLARAAGTLRVGGSESWRGFLRFAPGLADQQVSCLVPGVPGSCSVRVGDAVINQAELLLQPTAPPAGFAPLAPVPVSAATVLTPALVPLARSPLEGIVGTLGSVPADLFSAQADTTLALDITTFLRPLIEGPAEGEAASQWLALISVPEGAGFGIGAFRGTPRLRLTLTVANEVQLR